jgi:citronellol/citronellal dehydrogenase
MGMSFVTLGQAAEFRRQGVAVNALWPRTVIATDAINMIPGVELSRCRTPEILADAAHAILCTPSRELSGQFIIDEPFLRERGVSDFDGYAVDPSQSPLIDLFLDEAR